MNDETHFMEHRFPADWLDTISRQGTEITFVPWYRVADTLDVVFGHAGWQVYIIRCDELAGRIVVTIALDIGGIVKQNVGSEVVEKDSWGDSFTNAYAQAFKRAAAMHGFGRYLYEGDEDTEHAPARSASTPAASPPSQAPAAADATTHGALLDTVIRFGKNSGRTWREVVYDPDMEEAQYAEWACNTLPVERMSDELKAAVKTAFTDRVTMDQGGGELPF